MEPTRRAGSHSPFATEHGWFAEPSIVSASQRDLDEEVQQQDVAIADDDVGFESLTIGSWTGQP